MRWIRRGLLIIPIILALAIAGAYFSISLLIDPSEYEQRLNTQLSEALGYEVGIKGSVHLQLYPYVGIVFDDAVFLRNETKVKLATASHIKCKVNLFALLKGQIIIEKIFLHHFDAYVPLGPNTKHILAKPTRYFEVIKNELFAYREQLQKMAPIPLLDVNELSIIDGYVYFRDDNNKELVHWENYQFSAKKISKLGFIPITVSFTYHDLSSGNKGDMHFASDVLFNLEKKRFYLQNFHVQSKFANQLNPKRPFTTQLVLGLSIDFAQDTLTVQKLNAMINNVRIMGKLNIKRLFNDPKITSFFTIKKFETQNLLSNLNLSFPKDAIPFDSAKIEGSMVYNKNVIDMPFLHFTSKRTSIILNARYPLDTTDSPPRIRLKLNNVPIGKYFSFLMTIDEHISDSPAFQLIPNWKETDFNFKIDATNSTYEDFVVDNLKADINHANGQLFFSPIVATLYGGKLEAQARLLFKYSPIYFESRGTFEQVNMGPLLRAIYPIERLSGVGSFDFVFKSHADSIPLILQNLSGRASYKIEEGYFRGVNINYVIRHIAAFIRKKIGPFMVGKNLTSFKQFKGELKFSEGILHNPSFELYDNELVIKGQGKIDLSNFEVDYSLIAKMLNPLKSTSISKLQTYFKNGIPMIIKGTINQLELSIDPEHRQHILEKLLLHEQEPYLANIKAN